MSRKGLAAGGIEGCSVAAVAAGAVAGAGAGAGVGADVGAGECDCGGGARLDKRFRMCVRRLLVDGSSGSSLVAPLGGGSSLIALLGVIPQM